MSLGAAASYIAKVMLVTRPTPPVATHFLQHQRVAPRLGMMALVVYDNGDPALGAHRDGRFGSPWRVWWLLTAYANFGRSYGRSCNRQREGRVRTARRY